MTEVLETWENVPIHDFTSINDDDPKGISVTSSMFVTDRSFNIAAYGIMIVLAVLYTLFW